MTDGRGSAARPVQGVGITRSGYPAGHCATAPDAGWTPPECPAVIPRGTTTRQDNRPRDYRSPGLPFPGVTAHQDYSLTLIAISDYIVPIYHPTTGFTKTTLSATVIGCVGPSRGNSPSTAVPANSQRQAAGTAITSRAEPCDGRA